MQRRLFITSLSAAFVTPKLTHAAPQTYVIDPGASRITYVFSISGRKQRGTVPLQSADVQVDLQDLTKCRADVTADLRNAKTGVIFITDALKSPSVLDAETYPIARFVSTKVRLGRNGRISEGATLEGNMTLRGVTRPISLNANLFRPAGAASDDLSRLSVQLRGALNRSDYGAIGFPDLVADHVEIEIDADIRQV